MLGGDGCLSAAGKARRCFSPTCAPAGGEQESAGEQHAREAGAAQRDEQLAPGAPWAGECAYWWRQACVGRQA